MIEQGIPGAVVCVSVDGHEVWSEGIGLADVENDVSCSSHTVMRIASISKCLTAVAAMQLWEDGLLDLDEPVQSYVSEFPQKTFEGKEVKITSRQLLCHMAGIRHYTKASELETKKGEFENDEYFIKKHYKSVSESLQLFTNDDLLHAPGTTFHYTTHGWTLLSAVIEQVSGQSFLDYLHTHIVCPLGMDSTSAEIHDPLTYNRARYYFRDSSGRLQNSPFVDLSYKWAGGGLFSSAPDLCRFGSALLLCYQKRGNSPVPSIRRIIEQQRTSIKSGDSLSHDCKEVKTALLLQPETVSAMWKGTVSNVYFSSNLRLSYGLGWVVRKEGASVKGGISEPFCVGHTGAAVGASSVLVILPKHVTPLDVENKDGLIKPHGVVVAVLFNLQEVHGMFSLGSKIASLFLPLLI